MEPFAEMMPVTGGPRLMTIKPWADRFPEVTAGFSSRHGGVSESPFESLNCGLHVPDRPEHVVNNRRLAADRIGMPLSSWTYAEQVHGQEVAVVSSLERGKGTYAREDAIAGKDAFITNEPGICMAALFADCVPLYFYDPINRAAGLAHAGWKGTVLQIAGETVNAMKREFGSDPAELHAAIGPSIGPCCYEVDQRVIDPVNELGLPFYTSAGGGKYRLNLQEINRQIMMKAGILPVHIEISEMCTSCRSDLFFSHRKEEGKTGRMIAWIGLRHEADKRGEPSVDYSGADRSR